MIHQKWLEPGLKLRATKKHSRNLKSRSTMANRPIETSVLWSKSFSPSKATPMKLLSSAQLLAASPKGTSLEEATQVREGRIVGLITHVHTCPCMYLMSWSSMYETCMQRVHFTLLAFNHAYHHMRTHQVVLYRPRAPIDMSSFSKCPNLCSLSLNNCGVVTMETLEGCGQLMEISMQVCAHTHAHIHMNTFIVHTQSNMMEHVDCTNFASSNLPTSAIIV